MRSSHFWLNLFLICVGVVTGSMVSEMTAGIPWLSWLSYGLNFGTQAPVVLDLGILSVTFGISIDLTISAIIFVALSLILGKLIVKK
jgi:hypothetical protein